MAKEYYQKLTGNNQYLTRNVQGYAVRLIWHPRKPATYEHCVFGSKRALSDDATLT
jgi:hypothetical protein